MGKVAIITDTDSSLPAAIAEKYQIQQVPITIHFENENYTTGIDIDDKLVFEKVDRLQKLPTTSAPPPSAFVDAFEHAFKEGAAAIVCVCVSSKVSSTYNSAVTASKGFPEGKIAVIDSLSVSMGQGLMALEAAQAAQQGDGIEEIVARIESVSKRIHLYAALSTLKYLALSGRVGKFVAGMADTFDIKPILTVKDGKLDMLERVRTRKKAHARMLELVRTSVSGQKIERMAIIHVTDLDGAQEFAGQLLKEFPYQGEVITAEFTPGLSVHAGSGVVGVVILTA
jgi:DegV family protein with EDD domain